VSLGSQHVAEERETRKVCFHGHDASMHSTKKASCILQASMLTGFQINISSSETYHRLRRRAREASSRSDLHRETSSLSWTWNPGRPLRSHHWLSTAEVRTCSTLQELNPRPNLLSQTRQTSIITGKIIKVCQGAFSHRYIP
jgi:hypothetical protein